MELDTIVCGDCLDVMRDMPDGCVDLVVTDPPYNIGENYSQGSDNRDDYFEWCMLWFAECQRIAKTIILTPGTRNLVEWARRTTPTWIHSWYRSNATNRTGANWVNVWEPILRYGGKWKHFHDTLNLPISRQNDTGDHPCPKQLGWAEWLIKGASVEGKVIFDPFIGSGTTAVAALKLGRHFYGCDINPEYVKLANKRIEKTRLEMSQVEMEL